MSVNVVVIRNGVVIKVNDGNLLDVLKCNKFHLINL